MGVYSTLFITREDAIAEIMRQLQRATDEELSDALFGLVGDRTLSNFMIVDSYDEVDCSRYCDLSGGLG